MALVSPPALATIINKTTHSVLFDDGGFESQAAEQTSHIAYRDDRIGGAAASPVNGAVGTWSMIDPEFNCVQVADYASSTFAGAIEGTKYLRVVRAAGGVEPWATMNFASQEKKDDIIHWEAMVYIPTEGTNGNPIGILGNGGALFNIMTNYDGARVGAITPYLGVWPPTSNASLTYVANQWQKWEIDYAVGSPSLTLSVDGHSESLGVLSPGSLSSLSIISDAAGTGVYLDAVPTPEPGTLTLLGMGFVGLLAYAWKTRR
jgi:hypothetical protein